MTRPRLVAAGVLVAVAGSILGWWASRHDTNRLRPPVGFGTVAFSTGPHSRWCGLSASDDAQRSRGLMGRHDLAGFDAMVFVFQRDTEVAFWMRNTPMPLSIAWFRSDGSLVSTADMAPCADRADCPLYPPGGAYRYALEVPRGNLARLGVARETRLVLGGACRA